MVIWSLILSQASAPPTPTDEELTAAKEWLEKWLASLEG
jgi:hypothetical protein